MNWGVIIVLLTAVALMAYGFIAFFDDLQSGRVGETLKVVSRAYRAIRNKLLPMITVSILVATATPVHAQIIGAGACTTLGSDGTPSPCTSLFDQILQYVRQALQLVQETTTAEYEVTNTLALGGGLFNDATADLQTISNFTTAASLLEAGTGEFITKLGEPEYPLPDDTGQQQLVREQNAVSNAIEQLGNVIDHQNPLIANASAILNALQAEALLNPGRHMTQQDITQVNAAHAQWNQSHQIVTMATAQAQHAALLAQHDRTAMANRWGDLMATAYLPFDTGAAPGY